MSCDRAAAACCCSRPLQLRDDLGEARQRLGLSVRTIERHVSNIYGKLGVSGKAARAAVAASYSRPPERPWSPLG